MNYRSLIPPFLILLLFYIYFIFSKGGGSYVDEYVNIQKDLFLSINGHLSKFPVLQFNLTQLGDVLIFFPLLTVFMVYSPKLWEGLITSALLSLIVSAGLKKLFHVPRPAAMFDNDTFVIIGRTLTGNTSLPSGHSIATFVVITTLLFAFMPNQNRHKIIWTFLMLALGLMIAFSRVGVGAHYPFDVLIGSTIGFIVAVLGIRINARLNWLVWMKNKKFYPVFVVLFAAWIFAIIQKIIADNLLIFYFSIVALVISLYLILKSYVQEKN
ncbi:phosphatase PAP2 family protein [Maribellus sediminis]|uniref:phosphatase PAP2 family protein n=1 Tax=Maribellus sediminis TaxID=2696285 RepID=UPI00197D61E5|nr:phosphatase PAP2 family protein [Maribellus sediminis]